MKTTNEQTKKEETEESMKTTKKVIIESNGQQAPYGIGEIIAIMPATHYKKIHAFVSQWYNPPTIRDYATKALLRFSYSYDWTNKQTLIGFTKFNDPRS